MTMVIEAIDRFFANSSEPVLFAGAGVSARAGVLTWGPLLDRLKEWIRSRDPQTANLMADYIHEQDLITAADYFFLSKRVPDGERLAALVEHLSEYTAKQLLPLVQLPFHGFVTTNFDRCLLDAYANAHGKAALDFRHGDESFKQVLWCAEPFVARIHGGTELATSIVLTTTHFEALSKDSVYQDVLVNLFTRKNVLFVGCSFTDPAVRAVFEQINKQYGPTPPGLHMALIPDDVDHEFVSRLNRMNVDTIRYDPADHHRAVWDAITTYSTRDSAPASASTTSEESSISPFAAAKRYLASCYARVRLSGRLHPLREAVVEGIVSSIIQSHAPKGVSVKGVIDTIHRELGIHSDAARELVNAAIERLAADKLCRRHSEGGLRKVAWAGETDDVNKLDLALEILVTSALDRAVVQENLRPVRDLQQALRGFFREMVLQRGWDLGAAFASNRAPEEVDIGKLLYQSCAFLSHPEIDSLKRVCTHMLSLPTEAEAKVLAELGRASFALELAIQCPRNTLFHSVVLPQKVYLDANVLMPALTYGHPYHEVYRQTIDRLREATTQSVGVVQVVAYYGFLNEIVSHRRLAIQEVAEWGKDFREGIVKEAVYYGTTNMNVYVGAYANVAQVEKALEFPEFLSKYAPYTSEKELAQWLRQHGIIVQSDNQMRTSEYASVSLELQKAYSNDLAAGKGIRLIEHDAVQISTLYSDQQLGLRSILVTADKRLREMVANGKYRHLVEHMQSTVGLAQMIDLLVGNPSEARGLTSLLWTTRSSTKTEEVRKYLVALALREYDEAMAMEMPAVVEQIAEDVVAEAGRVGLRLDTDNATERRKFLQFVGAFEDKFFEAIREQIGRRERQAK
jgi:predicted nucleic acid-binding protein